MAIRVILVDDSTVIRGLMGRALSQDSDIEIIGTAANGEMAISIAKSDKPDIIVLDIEMPVMDGITALPQLLKVSPNSRIIMASTLTQRNAEISLNALERGASDYLAKPSARAGKEVDEFFLQLIDKIRALAGYAPKRVALAAPAAAAAVAPGAARPVEPAITVHPSSERLAGIKALAIASSTGGPQALMSVFEQVSGHIKHIPIFITQHMPPTFTTILADHIAKAGHRTVVEAQDGMAVQAGCGYVAPGDYHMVVEMHNGQAVIRTNQEPHENFCRPAADPMLRSLSALYGKHLLLVVLTGMGQDGLEGAKVVVKNGGHVIAQNETSCVVYGMPKAVVENKLCRAVLPLSELGKYLIHNLEGS